MRRETEEARRDGEHAVVCRCLRCGGEIYRGEAAYRLERGWLCPECLPDAARCALAGRLRTAGEGGGGMVG